MIQQPELGKKIADLRKAKGLTQEELVEKCNLNVRTLQRIESGEVMPRTYTIRLVFEALEVSFDQLLNDKGVILKWLEQFYISFISLFNLKTNTMKKISILSSIPLIIVFLTFILKGHSQSTNSNPLLGKWKLVGLTKEVLNLKDSTHQSLQIQIDNSTTRYVEFKSDLSFETRTIQNDIYNGGVYTLLNDTIFITVHFELNGELAKVSNLYCFNIHKDTLNFKGFYLERVSQLGENFYEKKYLDEWWIKIKNN